MSLVVLITAPDAETARRLAGTLVEERLAACVNIVPSIESIYRWQGAIQRDPEALLVAKTTADRLDAFTARVLELHPYSTPEVLALPVHGGSPAYLAWLQASVAPDA